MRYRYLIVSLGAAVALLILLGWAWPRASVAAVPGGSTVPPGATAVAKAAAPLQGTPTATPSPFGTPTPTANPSVCGVNADYTISQTTGAYLDSGTADIGNHCDDCITTITLPFAYQLYDQTFTTANVSSNGNLQFLSNSTAYSNVCLPYAGFNYAILPHWDDLDTTNTGNCSYCGIFTSVTGSAPNRVFNIEWRAVYLGTTNYANFEVRLYEGQSRFDLVYGQITNSGSGATVGVQKGTGSRSTQFECNTGVLTSGLMLIFTQPPCTTCSGNTGYTFALSTGVQIVPGTTDIGNHCDNCTTNITLPFAYQLYDQSFTTANAGSNGTLEFLSNYGSTAQNTCLTNSNFNYAILPYWDNLDTSRAGDGIFTSVTGSAPNRVFNIEWRGLYNYYYTINFEVRLYENQPRFDLVYGALPYGGNSASVGVQKDTGSRYTQLECHVGGLSAGLQVTFTQPMACTPTPTLTPTITPTATATATSTRTPVPPSATPTTPPAAPGPPIVIVGGPFDQQAPRISHHLLVYEDNSAGNWDIFVKNVAGTAPPSPVYQGPGDQRAPDISGDLVVWQDNRNGTWDIYGRHLNGGADFPIFTGPGDQTHPHVNGTQVVWESTLTPGHTSIVVQDLAGGPPRTLSDPGTTNLHPDIDNDFVVWQSAPPTTTLKLGAAAAGWQIVSFDFTTQLTRTLSTGPGDHTAPSISGNTVVWVTTQPGAGAAPQAPGDSNIDGQDVRRGGGGTPFPVTTPVHSKLNSEPRVKGRDVAFIDEDSTARVGAVVSTNLDTGQTVVHSSPGHDARSPDIDDDGNLVWRQPSGGSGGDADIYGTYCQPPVFSDVLPTDYFAGPVGWLTCIGAISGYADGTFRPYADTTRGQLAKIVVGTEGWTIDTTGGPHFSDVPAGNPFYAFIETAFNHGIISGYSDGTFRWGANVTRGQLSKIVVGAQGWPINTTGGPHFSDVPVANPFYAYVETAFNHGIISGYADGTFRVGANATRGQIAKIVYIAATSP